jgi:hypothetical protein
VLSSNRNVVLAWARAGGFANPDFMEEWVDDEEVLLEFLKQDSCEPFELSPRLANDKAFMLKAIKSNFKFYLHASADLSLDFDFALA